MNRRQLLRLLGAGAAQFAVRMPATAQGPLTLQPLSEHITVLSGAGGNITLLRGKDGMLMVDSGLPDTAAAMSAKIKESASLPVQQLINTHWHYDHTGGNGVIAQNGAQIIAQEKCVKRLAVTQHMTFMKRDVPALPVEARPKNIFTDKKTIDFADEKLELNYFPPAHTDGDITIHFPKANVYTTGDLFFNGFYPFIDYSSAGSIEGMIQNAASMLNHVDGSTKIVPGHGPVGTKADLQAFHDMLSGSNEQVSKLIKQGRTLDEIVAAKPTAMYDEKWGGGFLKTSEWIRLLYEGKTQTKAQAA